MPLRIAVPRELPLRSVLSFALFPIERGGILSQGWIAASTGDDLRL